MDAVFEQFDLMCNEPDGCDIFVQVLRLIVWSYFGIALLIFFVAIRPWTRGLPAVAGVAISAAGSLVIVLIGRSMVASSGSIRTLATLTGAGLLAAWIGRPDVEQWRARWRRLTNSKAERHPADGGAVKNSSTGGDAVTSPPGEPGSTDLNEGASPTSSTH